MVWHPAIAQRAGMTPRDIVAAVLVALAPTVRIAKTANGRP